jgi:hypothetical protein
MPEVKPQYRTLREAIISANLRTGATLRNQWVYEDQDSLEVTAYWTTKAKMTADARSARSGESRRVARLNATTLPFGSYAAHKTDFAPLAGRDVVVLPDHNESGRAYVRHGTEILAPLLPPAEVRVLELPGLWENGSIVARQSS